MATIKPQELSDAVLSLSRDKSVVCLTKSILLHHLFPLPPEGLRSWQSWKRPRERALAQVLGQLVECGELKRVEVFTPPVTDWSDGPVYWSCRDGRSISADTQRRIHARWMNRSTPKMTYAYRHVDVEAHFSRNHINPLADPGRKATSWIDLTSLYLYLQKSNTKIDWVPWWYLEQWMDGQLQFPAPPQKRYIRNLVRDSDVHAIYFGSDTDRHQIVCVIRYSANQLENLKELLADVSHWVADISDGEPVAGIQFW